MGFFLLFWFGGFGGGGGGVTILLLYFGLFWVLFVEVTLRSPNMAEHYRGAAPAGGSPRHC